MSITWTIADIEADWKRGAEVPSWTWGEQSSLEFVFRTSGYYDYGEGGYGEGGYGDAYDELLTVIRDAALATTEIYDTRGRTRYEERLPASTSVSSLVVDVVPGSSVQDADAVWALVVGGEDLSRPISGHRVLSLSVVPLAYRSAFADRSEVEAALGSGVV